MKAEGVDKAAAAAGGNPRIKFSPELRERIRRELEAGTKSVAEISREYGPSHPTIMGWKREWGMTRPRGKRGNGNGASR
jgi:transposase-like protein